MNFMTNLFSSISLFFYFQIFPEHDDLNDRLSKNLYYGRETPSCDRLSLPITGEYCMK